MRHGMYARAVKAVLSACGFAALGPQAARADDCIFTMTKAHVYFKPQAEQRLRSMAAYHAVAASLAVSFPNPKKGISILPLCITAEGIRFLYDGAVVLQHDYEVYRQRECQLSVVLDNAISRVIRIDAAAPSCRETSRRL